MRMQGSAILGFLLCFLGLCLILFTFGLPAYIGGFLIFNGLCCAVFGS